jgi:hypothetical protein
MSYGTSVGQMSLRKWSGQEGLWPLEGGTGGSALLFSDLGGSDFFSETFRHGKQEQTLVA